MTACPLRQLRDVGTPYPPHEQHDNLTGSAGVSNLTGTTCVCWILTPTNRSWPTSIVLAAGSFRSGSARLGRSQKDGLPSRSRGRRVCLGLKAINSRTVKGQPNSCPFQTESEMDAKTIRDLGLLAILSVFCAAVAWAVDEVVFSWVFAALGAVAAIGARPWRSARSGVTMTEENKEIVVLLVAIGILLVAPLAFGAGLLMMR